MRLFISGSAPLLNQTFKNFYRVKLGISNKQLKEKKVKPENFVLNKFDKSEREVIEEFKKLANKYFEHLILTCSHDYMV